ncbi:MAG: SH3 domain-containing protein [Anaerolineae bacterium]|nr:SH3 domain-containing protein [Anaerolineae bacterium]
MKAPRRAAWLVATILVAALMIGLMPARSASAQAPTATVNTGALHLRSGPGVSYQVVFSVYRGTTLTLLGRNANTSWLKVALDNGVQGWVNRWYVWSAYPLASLPVEGGTIPVPVPLPVPAVGTVNSGALNVRQGPSIYSPRIRALPRGAQVDLLARDSATIWLKVRLSDGVVGWLNGDYILTSYPKTNLPVEGVYVPPAPQPQPQPTYRYHTVQYGENMYRIGLRYGVNWLSIAAANGIGYPYWVYAGQVLRIP